MTIESLGPRTVSAPRRRAAKGERAVYLFALRFPPEISGAGLQIKRVGEQLARIGVPVRFVVLSRSPAAAEGDGLPVDRIPYAAGGGLWAEIAAMLRVLGYLTMRRRLIAALQLSGLSRLTYVLLAWGRLMKVPVVYRAAMLGGDEPDALSRERFGSLKVAVLGLAGAFVATTPMLHGIFARFYGRERVHLIVNGVDAALFRPAADAAERAAARRQLGLRPDAKIVVCNAVVCPRKRTAFILDAIDRVRRQVPDLQFVNIGAMNSQFAEADASYRDRVLAKRQEIGPDSVVLVDRTDQVHRYLLAADLFVFASRKEGCPNAVLEALTAGLPVVMTKLPGVSDFVVRDGIDGVELADGDDPGLLAAAILDLLRDESRRREFGKAARQRAEIELSLARTALLYDTAYAAAARARASGLQRPVTLRKDQPDNGEAHDRHESRATPTHVGAGAAEEAGTGPL